MHKESKPYVFQKKHGLYADQLEFSLAFAYSSIDIDLGFHGHVQELDFFFRAKLFLEGLIFASEDRSFHSRPCSAPIDRPFGQVYHKGAR